MTLSVRLVLDTEGYWVGIPAGLDVCHQGCAYIVLQTLGFLLYRYCHDCAESNLIPPLLKQKLLPSASADKWPSRLI